MWARVLASVGSGSFLRFFTIFTGAGGTVAATKYSAERAKAPVETPDEPAKARTSDLGGGAAAVDANELSAPTSSFMEWPNGPKASVKSSNASAVSSASVAAIAVAPTTTMGTSSLLATPMSSSAALATARAGAGTTT